MESGFSTLDYIVFIVYATVIVFVGLWVSKSKKGVQKTAQEYFLADKSLTWWAVGASLIAANISAEHFIGTSGSGFAIGLGIAAYEWIAAVALIIVAKYFLPVFLKNGIYTMPQFLKSRFDNRVSTAFAVFWLLVYVFVNLTSVSYLGALALEKIMGVPLQYGIIGLLIFSGIYSIYGGLQAVAWTDVVQVIVLIAGGLITTFLALDAVGNGSGIFTGMSNLYEGAKEHFVMIIPKGEIMIPNGEGGLKDAYQDLPGVAVILGAMWLTNIGYWGFNQYIIQKGLAAKSIEEAKKGLIFAGYLKILIPLLVVIPGIAAWVLVNQSSPEELSAMLNIPVEQIGTIDKSDEAYPWLLKNFVPAGIRGLAFAALAAAIVSSLASMINSTSTIFTMDIYREYFNPAANNKQLVTSGRLVALVALAIAMLVAPQLASLDQVFQYIQEYTGYIYPGVVAVFCMGLFWRQITANAALWTAIATLPTGIICKIVYPEMPFLLRMGYVFIVLLLVASVISFSEKKSFKNPEYKADTKGDSTIKTAYFFMATGLILALIGVIKIKSWAVFGFEAVFMMASLLIMLGIILYTNIKMKTADPKSLNNDPVLYNTATPFNISAGGIVLIVGLLYYFFWM
jgi:SSS family solute:Na+ symporter